MEIQKIYTLPKISPKDCYQKLPCFFIKKFLHFDVNNRRRGVSVAVGTPKLFFLQIYTPINEKAWTPLVMSLKCNANTLLSDSTCTSCGNPSSDSSTAAKLDRVCCHFWPRLSSTIMGRTSCQSWLILITITGMENQFLVLVY